jgi:hypothetical protein
MRKLFGLSGGAKWTRVVGSLLVGLLLGSAQASVQPMSAAAAVIGIYELSFLGTPGLFPIEDGILPVGDELVLKAHVTDLLGTPASGGSVTFQFCGRSGGQSFFNMDPAPSRECDIDGTARWLTILTQKVTDGTCPGAGPGFACMNFGAVRSPRTIGFRFRYASQRSEIQSGISPSRDASWILP